MANLTENSIWENGIYQLETDDPTLGGPPGFNLGEPVTGHANAQAQQLANRTKYLKDAQETFVSDIANATDPAKGSALIGFRNSGAGATPRKLADKARDIVHVKDYGATGAPGENLYSALNLIATQTTASVITIDNVSFTISPVLNFNRDITLVGTGNSVMTGNCTRAKLRGITRKPIKTLKVRSFPGLSLNPTKVCIFEKRAGNAFYAIQPLANGYAQILFSPAFGTSSSSLGAPHELTRAAEVKYILDCLVAHKTPSSTTNVDLNWGSSNGINIEQEIVRQGHGAARGNGSLDVHRVNSGGVISYTLKKLPNDNYEGAIKGNVAFYTSASSSNSVSISVNGTVVKTVSLVGSENLVKIEEFYIPFRAKAGQEVTPIITVTNNGASQAYVIAANLYKLNDVPSNLVSIDYFKVFDSGRSYRSNNGASDYAILDKDTGLFCGSYHGGETSISYVVRLDGVTLDPNMVTGTAVLFKECEVAQETNINSKLTSYVVHSFTDNGYDIKVNMTGSIRAEKFYTAMATTHTDFVYVTYPGLVDLSALASGTEYQLPDTNHVVYQTAGSTTTRSLQTSIEFTLFDESYNKYESSYILRSPTNYNKLYYAPVLENDVTVEQINFMAKHRFFDL